MTVPPPPPPPPPPGLSFDPANKDTGIVLTDTNMTATAPDGSVGPGMVKSTNFHTAGKWYWEFTAHGTQWIGPGFADAEAALTTYAEDAHSVAWLAIGLGWVTGTGGWQSFDSDLVADGAIGALAIDIDAGKFWTRTASGWENGDPIAGTGGYNIIATGDDIYATAAFFNGQSGGITANFAGPFAYSDHTGFNAWDDT
jgi:hypothetical protein